MSPWDIADLDRLAAECAPYGKRPACRIFTHHALAAGWHGTPTWLEAREMFMGFYRKHRAAHRERMQ